MHSSQHGAWPMAIEVTHDYQQAGRPSGPRPMLGPPPSPSRARERQRDTPTSQPPPQDSCCWLDHSPWPRGASKPPQPGASKALDSQG